MKESKDYNHKSKYIICWLKDDLNKLTIHLVHYLIWKKLWFGSVSSSGLSSGLGSGSGSGLGSGLNLLF